MGLAAHSVLFKVRISLILSLLMTTSVAWGQADLQPATPIERTIAIGQTHTYTVKMKQDEFLSIVVQQKGIDVGISVSSPSGKWLGDFDSSSGSDGADSVSLLAESTGIYRFDVTPLDQFRKPQPGRYEIRIADLRQATEQESRQGRTEEVLKARGVAVLKDTTAALQDLRQPQTRAAYQIRVARLLWSLDKKEATKVMEQAVENLRAYVAGLDRNSADYSANLENALDIRRQIIQELVPSEPEMALSFIRSTRSLINPDGGQDNGQQDRDAETAVASRLASTDPRRAFQIAEEVLSDGLSQDLISIVHQLRAGPPGLAANLTHDIVAKLATQRLLASPMNANLASELVALRGVLPATSTGTGSSPLLSEADFRILVQKMASELMAYSPPDNAPFTAERSTARNLANLLKQMSGDLQTIAPDRFPAMLQKFSQIGTPEGTNPQTDSPSVNINNVEISAGLAMAEQAQPGMRESLYQQVANKAARAGDIEGARQIIITHLQNPQRQQALNGIQRQAIYNAISSKNFEDALRYIGGYQSADERAEMVIQVVTQLTGLGLKRSTASGFLEQARSLLGPSPRAEGKEEMKALLTIARAFSRVVPDRSFEILDPLVDQFNEMSTSAVYMNGFPEKYYQDGELIVNNGNALAETGNKLSEALSALALMNFERAKSVADRIRPTPIRVQAYLAMAENALQLSE
jgi:hypothetical protein